MEQTPPNAEKCLCGSGRSFGRCCAGAYRADLAAWRAARETEARLLPRIAAFAFRTWGTGIFEAAADEFAAMQSGRSPDSLLPLLPIFDPWFAFTWFPDRHQDRVTVPEGWPRKPVGQVWWNSGPGSSGKTDCEFLEQAMETLYSALLVESIVPGWTLTVRDMLTGRRFRIVDPDVSRRAQPDDMLLSAVLTLDDRSLLLGTATHALPCDWRFELREERQCYTDDLWHPRRFWMTYEGSVFSGYREAYEQPPVLQLHSEGTVPDPVHLRWQVSAGYADTLERLRPLTACYGDEWALDEEHGPDGEPHMLLTWYEPGPSAERDDWEAIGYLYLDEGRLAADVPTPTLADRLIAEVAARAGDVTTLIETRACAPRRVHDRQSALLPLDAFASAESRPQSGIH